MQDFVREARRSRHRGCAQEPAGRGLLQQSRSVEQLRFPVRKQDSGEMSVKTLAGGRKAKNLLLIFALIAGALVLLGVADAFAQNPFGAPRAPSAPPPGPDGIAGWLLQKQAEFYRQLSDTIRKAKTDGSAVWLLMGISFAYGIFHAAGPGHGKAVISSYLVANQETWKRGVTLSFASALLQSLVAVVVVGICAWLLNATAKTMCGAEKAIEIASYALIAAFGARLVWTKGGGFMRALQAKPVPAMAVAD